MRNGEWDESRLAIIFINIDIFSSAHSILENVLVKKNFQRHLTINSSYGDHGEPKFIKKKIKAQALFEIAHLCSSF